MLMIALLGSTLTPGSLVCAVTDSCSVCSTMSSFKIGTGNMFARLFELNVNGVENPT